MQFNFSQSLFRQYRVISALYLRDIQTRAGSSYAGFLVGTAVPLIHLFIIVAIYSSLGRIPSIGSSIALYLSTAVLPFVIWSYTHQKMLSSIPQNSPLLSFPAIRLIDILISRSLSELLNCTLIFMTTYLALYLIVGEYYISDVKMYIYSLFLAYFLGISTGILISIINHIYPSLTLVNFMIIPIYWISCGTLFTPDSLPQIIRDYLFLFPLAHIVDMVRSAFFFNYTSYFYSNTYVIVVIIFNILIGLSLSKLFRNS